MLSITTEAEGWLPVPVGSDVSLAEGVGEGVGDVDVVVVDDVVGDGDVSGLLVFPQKVYVYADD